MPRSRSAIHSASLTSVFLPGTALMCWALRSHTSKLPSRILCTGRQNSPVLSMPTCVTPASASQSESSSNLPVVVPKVRVCLLPTPILQATTVFLCTSIPAHASNTTSMRLYLPLLYPPLGGSSGRDTLWSETNLRTLRQQLGVPVGISGQTVGRAHQAPVIETTCGPEPPYAGGYTSDPFSWAGVSRRLGIR